MGLWSTIKAQATTAVEQMVQQTGVAAARGSAPEASRQPVARVAAVTPAPEPAVVAAPPKPQTLASQPPAIAAAPKSPAISPSPAPTRTSAPAVRPTLPPVDDGFEESDDTVIVSEGAMRAPLAGRAAVGVAAVAKPQVATPAEAVVMPEPEAPELTLEEEADEEEVSVASTGATPVGAWDPNDIDEFWMRVHAIEEAGNRSDEDLEVALKKYGLRDKAHFDEVRDDFSSRFGDDPDFMQAAINARTRAVKQQMAGRMEGELKGELAPVEGVTLEQWAWLMAKIAGGGDAAELLALAKLEAPTWDRVSAEWNARMSRDTTATIATAYGQAFVASGPGPFAEAGKATAAAMLNPNQTGVAGKEPIPMERWIEITEAQSAASQQGIDASTVLKSYGMTPADWGTAGGWWSQHFNANAMKLLPEYNRLSDMYKAKFAKGFSADSIDF